MTSLPLSQTSLTISDAAIDDGLLRLLHYVEGAKGRWHRWQRLGASDAVLKSAIAHEIGAFLASSGPGDIAVAGRGGKYPRVWVGTSNANGRPTLSGKRLVRRVRDLLAIPYPVGQGHFAELSVGQSVWVWVCSSASIGQQLEGAWAQGVIQNFDGDRIQVAVAQQCSKQKRGIMARNDVWLTADEVFPDLPDWAELVSFQEHIAIIERSLLKDLDVAMLQANSDSLARLEARELDLIHQVSRWARTQGWRLEGHDGRWTCYPLRGQPQSFVPVLRSEDEAIADVNDFRRIYVRRDGRFLEPPKPVQLSLLSLL